MGYHQLMLRAEFSGDAFYAGGGSKGDLEIAPGPLDMSQVPRTITRNNEQITEVGTTEAVALEVRAYLSDGLGNLYGFNDKPYLIGEGDCAGCAEDLCQDVMHPQCLLELNPADLVFEANSGIFITETERNASDGAFVRQWRPTYSDDEQVEFRVLLGELSSQPKTIRLFDTSGCGCTSANPAFLVVDWALCAVAAETPLSAPLARIAEAMNQLATLTPADQYQALVESEHTAELVRAMAPQDLHAIAPAVGKGGGARDAPSLQRGAAGRSHRPFGLAGLPL